MTTLSCGTPRAYLHVLLVDHGEGRIDGHCPRPAPYVATKLTQERNTPRRFSWLYLLRHERRGQHVARDQQVGNSDGNNTDVVCALHLLLLTQPDVDNRAYVSRQRQHHDDDVDDEEVRFEVGRKGSAVAARRKCLLRMRCSSFRSHLRSRKRCFETTGASVSELSKWWTVPETKCSCLVARVCRMHCGALRPVTGRRQIKTRSDAQNSHQILQSQRVMMVYKLHGEEQLLCDLIGTYFS